MQVAGRNAIVTGGGGGIGGAIAARLVSAGARVVVADLDAAAAAATVAGFDADAPGEAVAIGGDVSDPARIEQLIARCQAEFGPVDLYFANAGVIGPVGLGEEQDWERTLDVNLNAHIRAARLLIPGWLERGTGYFVSTASAAGLLTQIGSAAYSVTKHAAVGFAEWLSVTYGDRGVRVSCLCPMGVETPLLRAGENSGDALGMAATRAVTSAGAVLTPDTVAELVMAAVDDERFLILPHPEVLDMYRRKGADYDRWLAGMRHYQARLLDGVDGN
ncbi:SDR family oxidoreductase [Nocardia seriolae]|uniref:3-oxoacyl-[acyl-carrier-protein] reductase n=1 Tax=Nocardia seriolae TaxID=37332 RepID=A0A0B8NK76_9NOCA|nr:SDR family oxidoreductase [Nocardia seriolae]APA97893.1 3-oxoacyl-[acyl-carrier-protein] reductase [Nocardia seriolae]MTJ64361.1 SDR family NAD(P)-dependent oxidoreductase [Nocardia seriolae]MTJ73602.1 SDR family NAD(P)-dependent oxidoreductase [Nocardia seriolae]MTJ87644.1 SDR family NAD(P)-dependent oxidoreductase [Nocardia seriolae]MTK31637.1 SDR family NAD(P)-dependent oxidoreductase [Nocardia seriolae]